METETKTAGEVLGGLDADDPLARVGVIVTKESPSIPAPVEGPKPGIITYNEAEEYLKHPNQPTATQTAAVQEGAEDKTETAEEKAIRLSADDMVWDDRDQKAKPWKEFQGLAQLKRDTDAEKYRLSKEEEALQRSKDYVDQNFPFLEAISKSHFATTLANTLRQGVSEENAIAAAFAAVGKPLPSQTQPQVSDDPEPFVPPPHEFDKDNPEHLEMAAENLRWQYRKEAKAEALKTVRAEMAPIQNALREREEREAAERTRAQQEQDNLLRIAQHNKQVMGSLKSRLTFDPDTLTPEQYKDFQRKLDEAGQTLGLTDEYVRTHPLTERDIIAVATTAFPHSNPYAPPVQRTVQGLPTRKPLQPGSNGGGGLQSGTPAGWQSESDAMRSKLEAMAAGKM